MADLINEIQIGSDSYADSKIISANILTVQSLDGNELQYDAAEALIEFGADLPTRFVPRGSGGLLTSDNTAFGVLPRIRSRDTDPTQYGYGAEVKFQHLGKLLGGKFFLSSIARESRTHYRLSCISAVGLLDNDQHYGGIYTGTRFSDLLAEIIGGMVPYTVAPELANLLVYGWLPIATRRENLHQALFALGASALKDAEGDLYIAPLYGTSHKAIPDSRVYLGGSVDYPDTASQVAVSEHTFVANASDEAATLFEGMVSAANITTPGGQVVSGTVVLFQEPVHDLVVENGTILESGVNYAVLGPSASCKLTGQKYTHTIRQVLRPEADPARSVNITENKITVTDATLVSIASSEAVADRLMAYYSTAKTVSTDIVVNGEKAGDPVKFNDPFLEYTEGIIESLDITLSRTLKAKMTVVTDYVPSQPGNYFENVVVLTDSGTWTAPEGVTKIRVVLIGGGQGGYSGAQGEKGDSGSSSGAGRGGAGGVKGPGGAGGKVLAATVTVVAGQGYTYSSGVGGAGGVCDGTEPATGSEGGASTFGELTSADGVPSTTGYTDLFGGVTYALPGVEGVTDGMEGVGKNNGGNGETLTIDGVTYTPGGRGDNDKGSGTNPDGESWSGTAYGGYGGGAAYGSNGEDGSDGLVENNQGWGWITGGAGGAGGAATVPGADAAGYGTGGQGGSGGGGGGTGNGGKDNNTNGVEPGPGGQGGLGSDGGKGAPGCVLIYY